MIKVFIIILFLFFNGCSTFKKDVVECPKLISPKKASEIVVNSESNLPVYIGFRGVQKFCFKDGNDIQMELSVNIRAIRNDTTEEDYVPVNISVGDTIKFEVNVSGHPFWIKTALTTGTNDAVTNPPAINNGAETGIITWTPNTPGTYYYICQNHSLMQGEIIVS